MIRWPRLPATQAATMAEVERGETAEDVRIAKKLFSGLYTSRIMRLLEDLKPTNRQINAFIRRVSFISDWICNMELMLKLFALGWDGLPVREFCEENKYMFFFPAVCPELMSIMNNKGLISSLIQSSEFPPSVPAEWIGASVPFYTPMVKMSLIKSAHKHHVKDLKRKYGLTPGEYQRAIDWGKIENVRVVRKLLEDQFTRGLPSDTIGSFLFACDWSISGKRKRCEQSSDELEKYLPPKKRKKTA